MDSRLKIFKFRSFRFKKNVFVHLLTHSNLWKMKDLSELVLATANIESFPFANHFIYFNVFSSYNEIL